MNPVARSSLFALALLGVLATSQTLLLEKHLRADSRAERLLLNLAAMEGLVWESHARLAAADAWSLKRASATLDELSAMLDAVLEGAPVAKEPASGPVRAALHEPPLHTDLRVRSYIAYARAAGSGEGSPADEDRARARALAAVQGASEAVDAYRQERRYRLAMWTRCILALDVAVLFLIGFLIVRPTLRRVQRSLDARVEAEKELREANAFLDSIVENIPNMIFVKEARELRFVRFNRAGEELLGYKREQLIGRNDYDFFPRGEADFFTEKDRAVLRNGALLDIPEEPIHTQRGVRWLHTRKIPVRDEHGEPAYLLGISEDITGSKHAGTLAAAVRRIADDVTRTPGLAEFCAAVHATLKDMLYAENFYVALLDERRGELWFPYFSDERDPEPARRPLGKGLTDYVVETARPLLYRGAADAERLREEGYEMLGSACVEWLGAPLLVGGRSIGVVAVQTYDPKRVYEARDVEAITLITQQLANAIAYKQVEERTRRAARQLAEAQRLAGLGSWELDATTGDMNWSDEMFRIAGLDPVEKAPGLEAFLSMLDAEGRKAVRTGIADSLRRGVAFETEVNLRRRDGSAASLFLVGDAWAGSPRGPRVIGTMLDITARKRAEQEIKERFDQVEQLNRGMMNLLEDLQTVNEHLRYTTRDLEAANAELEAFSYSVSHDLRAPLRAIDGFVTALFEDQGARLDGEGQRMLRKVADSAKDMGRLIDGLLEFARLGRQPLTREAVDMTALARSVWGDLAAARAGRSVELRLADLAPASGDPVLLRQVWANLLANAIKFTHPVAAAVVEVGCSNGDKEAVYHVKDNGVGFDMKYVDKLFGVFQRLHSPGEFEGTGLGSAIVKRIVQRHGGRVWAEAEVDKGATFHFSLPRAEAEP